MILLRIRDLRTWISTLDGVARAVDGVDLDVGEGEAVGVVGESGSGKSMLALSVPGLLPRPGGRIVPGSSIRFRGRELVGASEAEVRRIRGGEVAMVFQEPMTSLNPVFTVGSQVRESLELHRGLKGRAGREEGARLLEEVGIPEPGRRLDAYPHQLSGGMRQRVMIAMALAGDPDLLIADEPTTALDTTVQAQILDLLDEVRRLRGMALLLVSHDLATVGRVCERMVVMYGGRIMEEGSTDLLLTSPAHPYTRGLLASRPARGEGGRVLEPIPGEVPEATDWPGGCRFHPRCLHAWDLCREREPELPGATSGGPRFRCWLREEGGGRDAG
jgi:oligopeptide/dipeptide ABC transporter ATP-binding protein